LNRTATFIGKKLLQINYLSYLLRADCQNQTAIKELSEKLDWRQELLALAKITNDTQSSYEDIKMSKFPSTVT
jgi:hypothetical protein